MVIRQALLLVLLGMACDVEAASLDALQNTHKNEERARLVTSKILPALHCAVGAVPPLVDWVLEHNGSVTAHTARFLVAASYVYGIFAATIDRKVRSKVAELTHTQIAPLTYSPMLRFAQGNLAVRALYEFWSGRRVLPYIDLK